MSPERFKFSKLMQRILGIVEQAVERGAAQVHSLEQLARREAAVPLAKGQQDVERAVNGTNALVVFAFRFHGAAAKGQTNDSRANFVRPADTVFIFFDLDQIAFS